MTKRSLVSDSNVQFITETFGANTQAIRGSTAYEVRLSSKVSKHAKREVYQPSAGAEEGREGKGD